jgi:site-specific DNA-methyltransferase (adenine-specific)
LLLGDCRDRLDELVRSPVARTLSMVFADPPYFLGKAPWDPKVPREAALAFHEEWLGLCRQLLERDGTVWVSGTYHGIHLVAYAAERVGMRLLASVTWEKTNPPPSRYHRCFTHATETLLWMSRSRSSRHRYDDQCMRRLNSGQPMKTHWYLPAVPVSEKECGRHPTQKPIAVVERCILAATAPGDLVLDPFMGSGTTALVAAEHGRRFIGIEQDARYLRLARRRLEVSARERAGKPAC